MIAFIHTHQAAIWVAFAFIWGINFGMWIQKHWNIR